MKWLGSLFLILGVLIGATGAALALSAHPKSFVSSVLSAEEEYLSTDDADVVKEHTRLEGEASTSSATLISANLSSASATSSSRSVRIPVLVYHSVRLHIKGESKLQDAYDITPQLLEQELIYLNTNGYHAVSFADVNRYFDDGTPLPNKPVILSFDDGWKNQYEHALLVLLKYNTKATFFIYTNPIDHKKAHWMSWDEVKTLDKMGMEIGGHSRTHPVLTKITSDAGLDKEISGSKKILESHLGHPVKVFAYPFGMHNAAVDAAVKRAGYASARTVVAGVWNDPEHRYDIHGTISGDKWSDFLRALNREY